MSSLRRVNPLGWADSPLADDNSVKVQLSKMLTSMQLLRIIADPGDDDG